MIKKNLSVLILILPVLFFTSCTPETPGEENDGTVDGVTAESITLEITVTSNSNPVSGVTLSYEGNSMVTDNSGTVSLTIDPDATTAELPQTVTITASKKFFVSSESVFNTADYTSRAVFSENIEIAPRIFTIDKMGNTGTGRIVAIDDMSGSNRVDLSEIPGYIDTDAESDEDAEKLGCLDCPTAINVDYDNGIIYVFDLETFGTSGSSYNPSWLIRLSDFPETAADSISAADVSIFQLIYNSEVEAEAVHQAVITGPDELIAVTGQEFSQPAILKLSGMSSGTITIEDSESGNLPYTMCPGITILPDDRLMLLNDSINSDDYFLVFSSWGADAADWENLAYADPSAGDSDYFALAYRLLIDRTGRWLFIGDIYNSSWWQELSYSTRIARFDLNSTAANLARVNFGSDGSGTNQFSEPVLLAILPDNRLYIKDVGNQRLVRTDLSGSTFQNWAAYKPEDDSGTADVDESFGFDYFYNGC